MYPGLRETLAHLVLENTEQSAVPQSGSHDQFSKFGNYIIYMCNVKLYLLWQCWTAGNTGPPCLTEFSTICFPQMQFGNLQCCINAQYIQNGLAAPRE